MSLRTGRGTASTRERLAAHPCQTASRLPALLLPPLCRNAKYSVGKWHLTADRRFPALVREVTGYKPDILALQVSGERERSHTRSVLTASTMPVRRRKCKTTP